MVRLEPELTTDGIRIASSPGSVVWQKDTTLPQSFCTETVPVPSTHRGFSSNGFFRTPLSQ